MIHFIFGGLYQGQEEHAWALYPEFDWSKQVADQSILYPAEEIFRNVDVQAVDKMLDSLEGDLVIVGNEIGAGVVPLNKADRDHRDHVGRVYQTIVRRADRVTRCFAGICESLK